MLLSFHEIEERFDDFLSSHLYNEWKDHLIRSGLFLEIESNIFEVCMERFEFQKNSYDEFSYLYTILSESEYRKRWVFPHWF
ncbi:hypothetical protein [Bacillus sp. FJAT-47783]|uniref:hypothetical protein n=1 Tax=Bacillus sp. FJAT-47783 TaxID=2922712 RepID=UPI001FADDB7F|nr:hypothetical protein [Bacillus sp. FJAT-47783]